MANDFASEHVRSTKKTEFYPSLILNDSLFELKIIDLPTIPFFPSNTDVEWNEYRFYGLRSASAYLLVYDASVPSTFQFIKTLRDQMLESRDMTNVPVIVAANKMDLLSSCSSTSVGLRPTSAQGQGQGHGSSSSSNSSTVDADKEKKEVVHLVKKTWRAAHVECSAKFNWNVVTVFKELAVTLDMIANGQMIGPGSQNSVKKRRCLMF